MSEVDREAVRAADGGDATEVARMLREFNAEFGEPAPPLARLSERVTELLADGAVAILLIGRPALGLAVLRLKPSLWSAAEDAYLEELYIVPPERGHGLGRRLLEATIDAARAAGADHFELNTGETDTEARKLYESVGMTNREGGPDGPRMLYYELDL